MNYQEYIDQTNERIRLTKQTMEQEEKRYKRNERLSYIGAGLGILILVVKVYIKLK